MDTDPDRGASDGAASYSGAADGCAAHRGAPDSAASYSGTPDRNATYGGTLDSAAPVSSPLSAPGALRIGPMITRQKLIDQLYHTLELAVVKGTGVVPFVKPDVGEIVTRVNTLSGRTLDLRKPTDFFDERLSVDVLDRVADDHTRKAQVLAATAGAGTGSLGIPGIALDVPILVTATVGLVRRHALTYGFTEIEDSQGDAVPLLLALGASVGAEFTIDQIAPRFAQKVGVDVGGKSGGTLLAEAHL